MQSDRQGGPLKKWEPLDLSKNDKRFVLSYIGRYHLVGTILFYFHLFATKSYSPFGAFKLYTL